MADSDIQNKNAASEDDLGTVHRLVTQGFKMKVGAKIKKAKKSQKQKDIDDINLADLNAAASWCRYNKIVGNAQMDAELEGVVDELDIIRKKQRGNSLAAVGDD